MQLTKYHVSFFVSNFVTTKHNCINIGAFEITCYNRFLHFCQAIDFQDSTIMTVTNGAVGKQSETLEKIWNEYWKENGPIGQVESLNDNFVIGVLGREGSWTGKILLDYMSGWLYV